MFQNGTLVKASNVHILCRISQNSVVSVVSVISVVWCEGENRHE